MGKIVLEWPSTIQDKVWRTIKVDEHFSAKGNNFVKYDGKVYVYKDRRIGTVVLGQKDVVEGKGDEGKIVKRWVEVGRIDISGKIFLGSKDQMSYSEYSRTPEALANAEKFMVEWRARGRKI